MKTSLLLAFIASTALGASALAQSGGTTSGTGSNSSGSGVPSTTTGSSSAAGTSSASGAGSSGTTSQAPGSDSAGASSTPGGQSPNPDVDQGSSGSQTWNQGGWGGGGVNPGNGGFGGQPMLQGMMTCVSPAPMGGFGSFACYPAGWGMGMMENGWQHPRHHGQWYGEDSGDTPNDYYENRQRYHRRSNSSGDDYDNDWRGSSGGSGYDGNSGSDDYSNQ